MTENEVRTETAEETAAQKKKKMSKGTKVLLIIACVIVGIALLLVGTVLILSNIGERALTDDGSNVDVSDNADVLDNGTIRYKGKLYRYNDKVTTILLMGIDDKEKSEFEGKYGNANQSDVNVVAVLDPVNERMTLFAISRDAMCEIEVLDDAGNFVGPAKAQLAIAHSYGDGGELSCELTTHAVSGILHGISVPAYGSIYIDGIVDLVDLVGGVEVTSKMTYGPFVEGQKVLLQGKLTETYIRHRADTTEGNNERMQRENQVLLALVHTALSKAKHDPMSIPATYAGVKENVTTNITTSMMVYLAKSAITMDFDGTIHTVPGESVLGEHRYAEFNIDEEALFDMIIDIFYIPAEE